MRHSKMTKVMALMLSMVMITSVFVGNTLSRYVTSVSSTDSARVAVWGINGEEVTMELFNTAYDLDGKKIAEANLNDDGITRDKIIAPGTGGSSAFSIINFENDTIPPEVAYQVKISLDDSQVDPKIVNNTSIQWKLDEGSWGTFDQLKTSLLSLSGDLSGIFEYAPGDFVNAFKSDVEHKIAWQWSMDNGNNEIDTQMGNDALTSDIGVKISVSITAEQSDGSSVNMLDGANQVININDLQPVVFRSAAPMSELQEVKVNGETVDPSNYEVEEGSTIIKFVVDYLRTLLKGTYKIEIVSKNMTATAKFYVSDGPIVHNGIIPVGGTYYHYEDDRIYDDGMVYFKDYSGTTVYKAGDKFPEPQIGDAYIYGDYEYRYRLGYSDFWIFEDQFKGWGVKTLDENKVEYGPVLNSINGNAIDNMLGTFYNCKNLKVSPEIPNTVKFIDCIFYNCTSLVEAPVLPEGIEHMFGAFWGCISLEKTPIISSNVDYFAYVFKDCSKLTGSVEINAIFNVGNIHDYEKALEGTNITWIEGSISDSEKQKIAEASGIELINPDVHNGTIPTGGVYYQGCTSNIVGDYTGATVFSAGQQFPDPQVGDRYVYNGYEYGYQIHFNVDFWTNSPNWQIGWSVGYIGNDSKPGRVLTTINGANLITMGYAFYGNKTITTAPNIPDTVIDIQGLFWGCSNLSGEVEININPEWWDFIFAETKNQIVLTGTSTMLDEIVEYSIHEDGSLTTNVTVKK